VTKENKNELTQAKSTQTVEGDSHSDAELANLYMVRKHANTAPPLLKQKTFAELSSKFTKPEPWWKVNIALYAKMSGITACLALVVLVVGLQMMGAHINSVPIDGSSNDKLVYQSIQIHEFTEQLTSQNDSLNTQVAQITQIQTQRINYDKAYTELIAKQKSLLQLHTMLARVLRYNGELQLVTCKDDLLKISKEVVAAVYPAKANDIDFLKGQMLTLRFDENGHIVDMQTNITQTQC
jgi:hypothetical protein